MYVYSKFIQSCLIQSYKHDKVQHLWIVTNILRVRYNLPISHSFLFLFMFSIFQLFWGILLGFFLGIVVPIKCSIRGASLNQTNRAKAKKPSKVRSLRNGLNLISNTTNLMLNSQESTLSLAGRDTECLSRDGQHTGLNALGRPVFCYVFQLSIDR